MELNGIRETYPNNIPLKWSIVRPLVESLPTFLPLVGNGMIEESALVWMDGLVPSSIDFTAN